MAPIAKELEVPNSHQPETAAPASGNKAQPAALEIPVTVNGARTIAGSDKREPFSENTQTVLVFSNGAVIRLSSAVTSGQLLFLTNEKSKKEVVCQVVKSKNYSNVSGYVELEFTEAAPGFWGLRFPAGAPVGMTPTAAKTVSNSATPLLKSLEEKLADVPVNVPVQPQAVATESVSVPAETKPAEVSRPEIAKLAASIFEAPQKETPFAPLIAEKPAANDQKSPTIMDFLVAEEKAARLEASGIGSPVVEKAPTVESSKKLEVATATPSSTPPGTLSSKVNPAPGTYTFDFAADEVKIPAWLEPLARNSAVSSAVPQTGGFETKPAEKKADESWLTESLPTRPEIDELKSAETETRVEPKVESLLEDSPAEYSDRPEAVLTLSSEGHTPNFGSTLSMNSSGEQPEKSSSFGLMLKLAAVVLIVAGAGGWYWYSNRGASVSANGNAAVRPETVANPETDSGAISSKPANKSLNTPPATAADRNLPSSHPSGLKESNAALPAGKSGNPSGSIENSAPVSTETVQPEPVPAKKPAFGELHLAAPVVKHPNAAHQNIVSEPDPVIGDAGISGGSADAANLLSSKGSEPSAPITVGGDVKPAHLISAVPPAYPALARTQHIQGQVLVDALVDVNGRVSSMKVVSGPALLHQAAMDALRQWKYQAATLDGKAVPMHLTVTVQFRLQ